MKPDPGGRSSPGSSTPRSSPAPGTTCSPEPQAPGSSTATDLSLFTLSWHLSRFSQTELECYILCSNQKACIVHVCTRMKVILLLLIFEKTVAHDNHSISSRSHASSDALFYKSKYMTTYMCQRLQDILAN